jgi:tyrosyl-tRNA synthetase
MDKSKRLNLITRNCQEILTKDSLTHLLDTATPLNHYIGFEISGLVHLGTGLMSMGKIVDFLKAGVKCTIFLADWHSYLNNKLGGDWGKIKEATNSYFKEALIASLACFDVKAGEVDFVFGSDLYKNNLTHWETFMEVGKHISLNRNLRSISIMGKKAGQSVDMATLFYPPLQVADIFTLKVNLAHAGMDQRKAHVLAIDAAKKLKINPLKDKKGEIISPTAVHHNLVAGLDTPVKGKKKEELKMSKSKPDSAIFVHDPPDTIKEKIKKAYCPPREIENNPVINWAETLVFWGQERGEFIIKRPEKFGGTLSYTSLKTLKENYSSGALHPLDLKSGVADWLIKKLAPARAHFEKTKPKAGLDLMLSFL